MTECRRICVVDDDDGHAFLVESNLRRSGFRGGIARFRNGFDFIEHLHGADAHATLPTLILLDLNMPGMSGIRVLEKLRAQPLTCTTPVVILSSTCNPREIDHCYELGCNFYLMKPLQYEEFVRVIRLLGEVFQVIKLPGAQGEPPQLAAASDA